MVNKNSREGNTISTLLNDIERHKKNGEHLASLYETLYLYVRGVFYKNCRPEQIDGLIDLIAHIRYRAGELDAKRQIRRAIGFDHNHDE